MRKSENVIEPICTFFFGREPIYTFRFVLFCLKISDKYIALGKRATYPGIQTGGQGGRGRDITTEVNPLVEPICTLDLLESNSSLSDQKKKKKK